jgi:CRP/FNR family cyclic AMP-dependent transcriptional regulator
MMRTIDKIAGEHFMNNSFMPLFRNVKNAVTFHAGDTIFNEGDEGSVAYVILEGELEVLLHGKHLDIATPGSIVGEMALIDQSQRSGTVVAKTDVRLAPIAQREFTFMVQETPLFALHVMHIMADRLRKQHLD